MIWNWINVALVAVLVGATLYYAFQTRRQANLLNNQIKENRRIHDESLTHERRRLALERIRSWAEEVVEVISRPLGWGLEHPVPVIVHERLQSTKEDLRPTDVKSVGILKDAEQISGHIFEEVKLARVILLQFDAMLGTKEDIAEFRELFNKTDFGELEPITTIEDLTAWKKRILLQFANVVDSVTEELVPFK